MTDCTIKISPVDKHSPVGKIAEAEIHFTAGSLKGCKLIGFSIWDASRPGNPRVVTMPARQFSVNGERRSFALLRPLESVAALDQVRDLILAAYATHEAEERAAERGTTPSTAPPSGILAAIPGAATEKADPFF